MSKSTKPAPPAALDEVRPALPHECVLSPTVQAAAALQPWANKVYGEVDLGELVRETRENARAISDGNLRPLEAMLYGQATVLQGIFVNLSRRAANQEYLQQFQVHLSLALKAQAQSRATIEALVELRNPRPLAFVKQANITQGPQQVNNGTAGALSPRAERSANEPNELLETRHGRSLASRATGASSRTDPPLEAVGEVNGTPNG